MPHQPIDEEDEDGLPEEGAHGDMPDGWVDPSMDNRQK